MIRAINTFAKRLPYDRAKHIRFIVVDDDVYKKFMEDEAWVYRIRPGDRIVTLVMFWGEADLIPLSKLYNIKRMGYDLDTEVLMATHVRN